MATAITNLFPGMELKRTDYGFEGETDSLEKFRMHIRRQKILDTTRNILLRSAAGGRVRILLNKQVAYVGKVTFAEESTTLGVIDVTIKDDDIESLIDDIAPTTMDGEEII